MLEVYKPNNDSIYEEKWKYSLTLMRNLYFEVWSDGEVVGERGNLSFAK